MKHCSRCSTTKPLTEFGKNKAKRDGTADYCKSCYREYGKKWYERNTDSQYRRNKATRLRIKTWFLDYRKGLSCETCGFDHPATLDFHHKDPSQKIKEVTQMVADCVSIETIQSEIDKCSVLCSNCHRILHYEERMNND